MRDNTKKCKTGHNIKSYSKPLIFTIIFLACLISFGFLYVKANEVKTYNANEWDTFKGRTKEDVGEQYALSQLYDSTYRDGDSNTWYKTPASPEYPYAAGELTQDTHDAMVATTDYYRWLIGAKPLLEKSKHSDGLQAGALIRSFDGNFAHSLPSSSKPADMDSSLWELGANVDHNILSKGPTPIGSINNWINEGYNFQYGAWSDIGHRTAILNSKVSELQYGYAKGVAIGKIAAYNNTSDLPYYAFPAPGYVPTRDVYAPLSAWTIELNSNYIADADNNVKVTVTNLSTNDSYECTTANGKLRSSSNFLEFVQPEPEKVNYANDFVYRAYYKDGDRFKVEVEGLKDKEGKDIQVTYTTEFFDVKDYSPTIATGIKTEEGYKNIIMKDADTDKLNQVAAILSKNVKVETENGREVTLPLKGKWVLNESEHCWTNSVDTSALPDYLKDPDNVLGEIKVTYTIHPTDRSGLYGRSEVTEGTEVEMTLWKGIISNTYQLHQVIKGDNGQYTGIERFDQDDENVSVDERGYVYFTFNCTSNDSGTYYVLYNLYNTYDSDAYLVGGLEMTVKEKEVQSISITAPSKTTYKVGENIDLSDGKINITYEDNTTAIIDLAEDYIDGFSSSQKGISTVNVTYKGKTATFDCLIVDNLGTLDAEYGNTLGDIKLPSDNYGTYVWQDAETTNVGEAGTKTFKVSYKPNDNKYSEVKDLTVTLNVKQGMPPYDKNITLNATYGDTLAKVTLPTSEIGTYEFEQPLTTSVGNAGSNTTDFTVKFTPKDSKNYKTVTGIPITIEVEKAVPKYSVPTNIEAGFGDKLKDVALPEGFEWQDGEQSVGEVGKHTFKAKYVPNDTNNYKVVENIDIEINVGKATPEYQKTIEFDATYGDTLEKLTLPVANNGTYTWDLAGTTPVGNVGTNTFTVIFTPNDQENYRIVKIEAKVKVAKANPQYVAPTGLTATYGDTLSSVQLAPANNGKFVWQDDDTTLVGNAGERVFKAQFIPNDTQNYNIVNDIEIKITVEKANPTYKIPENLVVEYGKKLSDIELPSGFSWKNADQQVGNIGKKSFDGYYTPTDPENYNTVEVQIPLEVVKAKPSYTLPTGLTATYGDTLSSIQLPQGFTWNTPDVLVGDAGEHIFTATYTPTDTNNYETVTNIEITVKVNKAKASNVVVPTISEMTYNPNTHLSDITLPEGWSWENPNLVPTVGNTGYKAIYTPKDSNNYDYSEQNLEPIIPISVKKAIPTFDAPKLIAYKYDTLADVKLPELQNGKFTWQDDLTTSVGEIGTHTFKVTFTPNDTVNYEIVTDINATVEVGKAKPEFEVPTGLTATYGDKLSSIQLPHGFTWNTPDVLVGDAGEQKFIATFTPEDTENYAIVNNIEITIKVNKKIAAPIEIPTFDDMVYDPNRHLSDIVLPEDWTWENPDIVPSVNNTGYKAIYTPKDSKNYDYSKQNLTPKLTLNVKKATPNYTVPSNLKIGWGSNISDIVLPEGWRWQENGPVGELGVKKFKLTFTPSDTDNYNIISDIEVNVEVVKANVTIVPPNDFTLKQGSKSKLSDIELPEGWSWLEPETPLNESGTYTAVYTPKDTEHYNIATSQVAVNLVADEDSNTVEQNSSKVKTNISSPDTGDNIQIYFILLGISLMALICIIVTERIKKI